MYDGIKQAFGPTQKKTAPLKSTTGEVIQDREQQMERWVEHYTEFYARENVVTKDALNAIGHADQSWRSLTENQP